MPSPHCWHLDAAATEVGAQAAAGDVLQLDRRSIRAPIGDATAELLLRVPARRERIEQRFDPRRVDPVAVIEIGIAVRPDERDDLEVETFFVRPADHLSRRRRVVRPKREVQLRVVAVIAQRQDRTRSASRCSRRRGRGERPRRRAVQADQDGVDRVDPGDLVNRSCSRPFELSTNRVFRLSIAPRSPADPDAASGSPPVMLICLPPSAAYALQISTRSSADSRSGMSRPSDPSPRCGRRSSSRLHTPVTATRNLPPSRLKVANRRSRSSVRWAEWISAITRRSPRTVAKPGVEREQRVVACGIVEAREERTDGVEAGATFVIGRNDRPRRF